MGVGASKQPLTPLQQALRSHDTASLKVVLADPNTVLSSTLSGKSFREKKIQEPETKYQLALEEHNQNNKYTEGIPPIVYVAKHCCKHRDKQKTAEIFRLLLAEPLVTVDPEIKMS